MNKIRPSGENAANSRVIELTGRMTERGLAKRRLLLSFRPSDGAYAIEFVKQFGDQFCCSVTEFPKSDIRKGRDYVDWLRSTELMQSDSVLVILIGPETGSMKKIDWDTAAALSDINSVPAGLIGVLLPEYIASERQIPPRISANTETGYASVYTWQRIRSQPNQFFSIYDDAVMRAQDAVTAADNELPLRRVEY